MIKGNELEDSHTTYLNGCSVFNEAQRKYDLRNRSVEVSPPKKVAQGQAFASQPTKTQPRKEVVQQKPKEKEVLKASRPKNKELPKEMVPKEKDMQREEIKRDMLLPLTCRLRFRRSRLLSLSMRY